MDYSFKLKIKNVISYAFLFCQLLMPIICFDAYISWQSNQGLGHQQMPDDQYGLVKRQHSKKFVSLKKTIIR